MALVDLKSNLSWYGTTPPAVNYISDANSGASGFTDNMFKDGSKKPSQFTGIVGNRIIYPSKLVDKFNELNILDAAYNPTYMAHPFIVRGMQRKNKSNSNPQYWGFGSKSGFDDGLIRGGAVTVADRIVADTVRIAKFMASPKGLLWVVKQIGLGLTNPKVETNTLAPLRQTRIHSGITSLLSVAGTPLGLHFTTHGLPFANEIASYGNVQLSKTTNTNRLVKLKNDLFQYRTFKIPFTNKLGVINATTSLDGLPIKDLSGLAGPNSVYGIGITTITRRTDSGLQALRRAAGYGIVYPYSITNQYASRLSGKTISSTKSDDVNAATKDQIRHSGMIEKSNPKIDTTKQPTFKNYENKTPGNDLGADISNTNSKDSVYGKSDTINEYITLAYSKIPKSKFKFNDFRSNIASENNELTNSQKNLLGFGNTQNNGYYQSNNLEDLYGFGSQGEVGADRTRPNDFLVNPEDYTSLKETNLVSIRNKRLQLVNTEKFRGDKITAIDIGNTDFVTSKVSGNPSGLDYTKVYPDNVRDFVKFVFSDGEYGKNVMVFRATLTGLQDSFSPGWEKIDIMGRPDGAYLYNSYERSISFTFTVAATSRPEMIPMWRKLNYLSTYTMPDLTTSRPSGPFMRITIGDLYNATPGFIESLSYSIPDDATWDIAEDSNADNAAPKQLPMMVEVSMTYKIISDYRPKLLGRAYSLSTGGGADSSTSGNWLADSRDQIN